MCCYFSFLERAIRASLKSSSCSHPKTKIIMNVKYNPIFTGPSIAEIAKRFVMNAAAAKVKPNFAASYLSSSFNFIRKSLSVSLLKCCHFSQAMLKVATYVSHFWGVCLKMKLQKDSPIIYYAYSKISHYGK